MFYRFLTMNKVVY